MNTRAIFNQTFTRELWIGGAVFLVVVLLLAFSLVRARARPGRKPSKKAEHNRIEGLYTLMVAGIAAYLLANSVAQNAKVQFQGGGGQEQFPAGNLQSQPVAATVKITAFQWCWRFAYEGTPVDITGDCLRDQGPVLVLPAHERVRIRLTSADVIHEWWVPFLRFKMEAIPGHYNTVTTVIGRTGLFPGRCSEFCGIYHYAMTFELRAVTPSAYRAWLAAQSRQARHARPALALGAPRS